MKYDQTGRPIYEGKELKKSDIKWLKVQAKHMRDTANDIVKSNDPGEIQAFLNVLKSQMKNIQNTV